MNGVKIEISMFESIFSTLTVRDLQQIGCRPNHHLQLCHLQLCHLQLCHLQLAFKQFLFLGYLFGRDCFPIFSSVLALEVAAALPAGPLPAPNGLPVVPPKNGLPATLMH